jgi:hypothetical protein
LACHSVLVNGSSAGFFNSSRGLRQDDPLSPLLFIVVMEALSKMLSGVVDSGRLSCFPVGSRPPVINISHLLFADDILVFCEANPDHLRFLRVLLVCFEAIFGLKVNLAKSLLVPVGNVDNVAELASILGCGTSSLPLKYLGMPLGTRHKATSIWDDIAVKMERRLASWQKLYLSKGARVTLFKSTLSNLPTYFMSIFLIPTHVANRIEKLQRHFLWGGIGEEFKYHLVRWDKVCSPISEGGLGFRNLKTFNRALLGKWLWCYGSERDAWWRVVVDSKYGSLRGGWCSLKPTGAFGVGVGVWKNIRKGWDSFPHYTRFVVGDGSKISFWHDLWCGDIALKVAFPALFDIARLKDAVVADNLERLGDSFQ